MGGYQPPCTPQLAPPAPIGGVQRCGSAPSGAKGGAAAPWVIAGNWRRRWNPFVAVCSPG
eukprot:13969142-Alexandrium_andersonii.AAC.1